MVYSDSLDEAEYKNLEGAVADVEALLASSAPGTRPLYKEFLKNAKARLDFLAKQIEQHKEEKVEQEKVEAAVARLAQNEAALNASEKVVYSEFLAEKFFTRKDFGKLADFYVHTYDRLSDGGKEEMSHRIWEGIRHDEYRFTDLPEVVQEKEAKRIRDKLAVPSIEQDQLRDVPEADRTDFLRAFDAGKQKEARQILNRESFRQNVSSGTAVGVKHQASTMNREMEDSNVLAGGSSTTAVVTPPETSAMTAVSQAATVLKNLSLVDAPPPPVAAALPNALVPGVSERSPS